MRPHTFFQSPKYNLKGKLRRLARKIFRGSGIPIYESHMLLGKLLTNQLLAMPSINSIREAEFSVFSQWGDDGIIQFLIQRLNVRPETFIEFGVEDYRESNTRFLLMNNNWRGMIIEANSSHVNSIVKDEIYWKYDLTAICDFINVENINSLFERGNFTGELGILSIDIDGNDYWVWEAIKVVNPIIVILEYNSLFGKDYAFTVPYDPEFVRTKAHYSNLYYGASLKALCQLPGKRRGTVSWAVTAPGITLISCGEIRSAG